MARLLHGIRATAMTDARIFSIKGSLTFQTAPELLVQSEKWMTESSDSVTIDFSSAGRTDSAGIALMLEWIELAKKQNLELKFENIPDQINEFVETNGLDHLIRQYTR